MPVIKYPTVYELQILHFVNYSLIIKNVNQRGDDPGSRNDCILASFMLVNAPVLTHILITDATYDYCWFIALHSPYSHPEPYPEPPPSFSDLQCAGVLKC